MGNMVQFRGVIIFSFLLLLVSMAIAIEEVTAETATTSAPTAPSAMIVASPTTGTAPLGVTFTVSSSSTLTSHSWDFQGDGIIDSSDGAPTFSYVESGAYTVTLSATTENNETINASTAITVKKPTAALTLSLTAKPLAGVAPLAVQFLAVAANGKEPVTYAWDYTADGTIDSTQQNPATTFDNPGEYNVTLTVTDAAGATAQKVMPITVTAFDSLLELTSYFPDEVVKGENKITLIVKNGGERPVTEVTARLVGKGVQQVSSSSISSLKPGEEDSITVTINILKSGAKEVTAKVLDKTFPLNFTLVQEIEYNKEELEIQYNLLKEKLQEQERIFTDKKSQNYLVGEIFESSIKPAKKQVQDVQEQLLTGKLAEAKVGLDLLSSAIEDITVNLENSQKLKISRTQWIKDNATVVTVIVAALAALGTLLGFLAKAKSHVQTGATKLAETVKQKFEAKKNGQGHGEKPAEHQAEHHAEHKEEPKPAETVKEESPEPKPKKKGRKKKKEGAAGESVTG